MNEYELAQIPEATREVVGKIREYVKRNHPKNADILLSFFTDVFGLYRNGDAKKREFIKNMLDRNLPGIWNRENVTDEQLSSLVYNGVRTLE